LPSKIYHASSAQRLALFLLLLSTTLLAAFQAGEPAWQTTVLYDGALGGTPDTQGFTYVALAASASQTYANGLTILDTMTTTGDLAGYFGQDIPPLDRQEGYSLQFTIQMIDENHDNRHRAGFSIILLSADLQGIELSFWPNEIWAQEGGEAELFTHAEGTTFDTTAVLTTYELHIAGDTYALSSGGIEILSGPLRDYTAFEGLLDPYETPNLVFLGDNTTRGRAEVHIAYAALHTGALATSTPSPTATLDPTNTPQPTATFTPTPTPTPQPTRSWYWWFPFTSGYPAGY
jgi:hypothetical protein